MWKRANEETELKFIDGAMQITGCQNSQQMATEFLR